MSDTNGHLLTAATFFAQPFKRRYRTVNLPGGVQARIRNLTEKERAAYEHAMFDVEARRMRRDSRIALIALCLVDAAGEMLFPDYTQVVESFRGMDSAITNLLFDSCFEHCGMTPSDAKALIENFEGAGASS